MANISEKIQHASPNEIHLYKEGVFWVAYEQSAWFVTRIKPYKPTRKFIKAVGREVVSVGFPESALKGVAAGARFIAPPTQPLPLHLVLQSDAPIDETVFLEWKNGIETAPVGARFIAPLQPAADTELYEKIKNFDLANATPMDCMNFLHQLKPPPTPQGGSLGELHRH